VLAKNRHNHTNFLFFSFIYQKKFEDPPSVIDSMLIPKESATEDPGQRQMPSIEATNEKATRTESAG
jgi:hypothetical protein